MHWAWGACLAWVLGLGVLGSGTLLASTFDRSKLPAIMPVIDPETGLKLAPNWQLVRAHCGACHSYRLVTAQRGDRDYWLKTIRWMQRTQNFWALPPSIEDPLLDYLAQHYDESDSGRRPPLSPALRPGP